MDIDDLMIEILKDIRAEIRSTNSCLGETNARVNETNARIDETNTRVDETIERLDETIERLDGTNDRLDETNRRLETMGEGLSRRLDALAEGQSQLTSEVVAVATSIHDLTKLLREDRALRATVDDHDRRIAALEARAQ